MKKRNTIYRPKDVFGCDTGIGNSNFAIFAGNDEDKLDSLGNHLIHI